MASILHLKKIGVRWHYLGKKYYENDYLKFTGKEMQIGSFKEGFSSHLIPCLHCVKNFI
jgi:hypothetical protein